MSKNRMIAWFKTIVTVFVIVICITLYSEIFDKGYTFQDVINLLLGMIVFHLLTDKYERELNEK